MIYSGVKEYALIRTTDRVPIVSIGVYPIRQIIRSRYSGDSSGRIWSSLVGPQCIHLGSCWSIPISKRVDVLSNYWRALQSRRQPYPVPHWANNLRTPRLVRDCTSKSKLHSRALLTTVLQLVGAIVASALILGLTPGPLLIKNKLGTGVSLVQGVFIEMFCTAILILAILMLAAEKSKATPMAPIGISMTLFACHMFAVSFTGASLNPARSFGPSCLIGFGPEHWIYWVGPLAGSCLSVAFYAWLKRYVRYPQI